jgi:hypothetical protein
MSRIGKQGVDSMRLPKQSRPVMRTVSAARQRAKVAPSGEPACTLCRLACSALPPLASQLCMLACDNTVC